MKYTKLIKSSPYGTDKIIFDSIPGGITLSFSLYDLDLLRPYFSFNCFSAGSLRKGNYYYFENSKDYEEMMKIYEELTPQVEQICSEFDNKIINLMKKYGFEQRNK